MVERVPASEPGAEKRRTSRLAQKVPLTVTGQDALGEPFSERTSTVAVNCHGCMFSCSSYLLKDSVLTLDIVSAATGEHTLVRAKVIRVQKPQQLGDPFLVAAALEEPGNLWGVNFPPKDWSAYLKAMPEVAPEAAPPAAVAASPHLTEKPAYEPAPAEEPEASKRRSTRIVQSVPLTVIGVNALGQAFKERTSTLIVNCHGCKYASKHYVLKNSWLTLEVPHPQSDQPPRRARGKVTFVQRPRTVRELFQIGVELEVPGNLWGIAFPPADWFPWPPEGQVPEGHEAAHPPVPELPPPASPAAPPSTEPKVRAFPPPGAAEIAKLASQQMAKLLAEARQQLQASAREAAASAVATETGQLLRDLNRQLETAAHQAVQDAASAFTEEMVRRTTEQLHGVRQSISKELQEQVARSFEGELHSVREQLLQQLASTGDAFRASFAASLEEELGAAREQARTIQNEIAARSQAAAAELEKLQASLRSGVETSAQSWQQQIAATEKRLEELRAAITVAADSSNTRLREQLDAINAQIEQRRTEFQAIAESSQQQWDGLRQQQSAEALGRLQELENAAGKLREEMLAETRKTQSETRQRLEDDLATAALQWNERVQASVDKAAEKLTVRLRGVSRGAADEAGKEMQVRAEAAGESLEARVAGTRDALESRLAETQKSLEGLRAALAGDLERAEATHGQIAQLKEQVENVAAEVAAFTSATLKGLDRRVEEAFAARAAVIDRRADQIVASLPERMQPVLEAAVKETTGRLIARMEEHLDAPLQRAEATLEKLAAGEAALSEGLRVQSEQIRRAGEESVRDGVTLMQSTLDQLRQEFDRAARESEARWMEELDQKTTEATHTTFEALYKAADWYQKKAQTSMQTALDKLLHQSSEQMREKAGELSRLFGQELDHYSRSYVEHAREQIEESSQGIVGRSREQLTTAADATGARFGDDIQRVASDNLEALADSARCTVEETATRLGEHAGAARSQIEAYRAEVESHVQRLSTDTTALIEDLSHLAREGLHEQTNESYQSFAERLAARIDDEIERARRDLETSAQPILDSWRAEREAQQREWRENLARISGEGVEQHRQRLESASNSWMLAAAATLNQQAQSMLDAAAQGAERRLRETSASVLASLAETFRERLLRLSTEFGATPKPEDPAKK